MPKTCMIVADGIRARFITVEVPVDSDADGGPRLLEHQDLVNPEADVPARELFSDRSGRTHASPGGSAHGLDDHREQHQADSYRRFAHRIADAAERFTTEHQAQRLILLAPPRLLGVLRPALDPKRLVITEVGEDLSRQPLQQIHEVLAARGLVPAMQAPRGAVFRPRGQPPPQ